MGLLEPVKTNDETNNVNEHLTWSKKQFSTSKPGRGVELGATENSS